MGENNKTMRWITCIFIILPFGVLDGRPMESFNRIQEQNTNIDQDSHPCPKESTSSYCLDPPGYPSSQILKALVKNTDIVNSGIFQHTATEESGKKCDEIFIKLFVFMQTTL